MALIGALCILAGYALTNTSRLIAMALFLIGAVICFNGLTKMAGF